MVLLVDAAFSRSGRSRWLLAALPGLLLASPASPATIRVPTDRSTIQAAIGVMQPGDTIEVAAGTYDGPFDLGGVRCTPALPCTIHGAGMFATVLRGMRPVTDWQDMGNGVFRRTMQASVDPITTGDDGYPMRDAFDPANIYQRNGYVEPGSGILEHLPLGYAGDSVTTPGDGRWSYDPVSHAIYVNPYGQALPSELLVPFLSRLLDLRMSTGWWTIQDLSLEGSRAFGMNHENAAGPLPGMVFRNVGGGYVPRWWAKLQPVPGIMIDHVRLRWIARGMSAIVPSAQRSGYGLRFFNADGATYTGVDCSHLGAGQSWCGGPTADTGCMPPWNTDAFTTIGGAGHCIDIKQTDGFTFEGGVIDDGPVQGGLKVDVSRNGTVRMTRFSRNVTALVLNAQTPAAGFNTTYSILVDRNLFDQNGMDFADDTPATNGFPTATLIGNRRTDGGPLQTQPTPLPPSIVILPDTGGTTTSTTSSTTMTTRSTTTSTSTSSSTSSSVPPTSTTMVGNSTTSSSTSSSSSSSSSTSFTTTTATSTTATTTLPPSPRCGNGIVEPGEECDDGNQVALDGCDANCLREEVAATRAGSELSTVLAPPTDPLAASIVSPTVGTLVIVETSPTVEPPPDLTLVGRQVYIQAPTATAANPIEIRLTIDNAVLTDPGVSHELAVLRDGVFVNPCTGSAGRAMPNPCVSGQDVPDVDLTTLVVLSTRGGNWNLVVPDTGSPTTTTTVIGGGTTTSTTMPRSERHVRGTELLLRDKPGRPAARRLMMLSRDAAGLVGGEVATGPSAGGADSLRMVAIGGDRFDVTYPLAASGWTQMIRRGVTTGIRYVDGAGPITRIVFRKRGELLVVGKGPLLRHTLHTDPDVVQVELRLGGERYCFAFGGVVQRFETGKSLLRRSARPPQGCP